MKNALKEPDKILDLCLRLYDELKLETESKKAEYIQQRDGLKTYYALPDSHLHCDVNMEITIQSKGNAKEIFTNGKFSSTKGRYSVFKIDNISGKFKTDHNSINFYDVEIDIWNYKIATDALSIVDKKLQLNPIQITDENGNVLMTYIRE